VDNFSRSVTVEVRASSDLAPALSRVKTQGWKLRELCGYTINWRIELFALKHC